jgi:hypothetical protein
VLLCVGALIELGRVPGALAVVSALGLGLAGLLALYALGVLVLCASFRAMQLQNLTFLMEAVLDFGRWPAQVFRGALRVVFTYVVPLAVMTTYAGAGAARRARWRDGGDGAGDQRGVDGGGAAAVGAGAAGVLVGVELRVCRGRAPAREGVIWHWDDVTWPWVGVVRGGAGGRGVW